MSSTTPRWKVWDHVCGTWAPQSGWLVVAALAVACGASAAAVPFWASAAAIARDAGTQTPVAAPQTALARFELVDQMGGAIRTVAAAGNRVVVGSGTRVAVLDVSDAAKPVLLGTSQPLGGVVQDVVLRGDVAWVAAGNAGLYALDLSTPTAPAVMGHHPIGQGAWLERLQLHEDLAIAFNTRYFTAAWPVWLLPIGDPAGIGNQPVTVLSQPSPTNAVAAVGDTLFIAAGDRANGYQAFLRAYDIGDPSSPRLLRTYPQTADPGLLAAIGQRLLLISGSWGWGEPTRATMFDVGPGGSLSQTAQVKLDVTGPSDVAVEGDHLFLFAGYDLYAYDIQPDGRVLPAGGPLDDERMVNAWSSDLVAVPGGYGDDQRRLRIFDAADPAAVREVASLDYGRVWGTAVAWRSDRLYVAGDAGLLVADLSRPDQPQWVGQASLPRGYGISDGVRDIGFLGDRLIVVQEDWLSAYDLSNPDQPILVAEAAPLWNGSGMSIRDGLVYLADSVAGVTVWRLVSPAPGDPDYVRPLFLPTALRGRH